MECCAGSSIISCLDTIYFFVKANEYFHWHSIGHGRIILFKIILHFPPAVSLRGQCPLNAALILYQFWSSVSFEGVLPGLSMFALEEGLTLLLPNGKCYKIFLIPLPNQTFLVIPPKIFSPGFNGHRDWGLHPPSIQSRYVSRCSGAGRAICKMSICQSESPPWWHSSGCSRGIHGDSSDERICHRSQVCDGADISSSSSSSVSSLWSALVLTLDRGGLQICFVCFWLRNPKLIVVPRCSSPNFRDQQTLTGCCYCWMDQNKQINSWINQTQMII